MYRPTVRDVPTPHTLGPAPALPRHSNRCAGACGPLRGLPRAGRHPNAARQAPLRRCTRPASRRPHLPPRSPQVRTQFRKIFMQMGFEEMPTNNYVESSFWNFDALFQPQQHPARDAHDTFFLTSEPGGRRMIPAERVLAALSTSALTKAALPAQARPCRCRRCRLRPA